jgi:hypothetical protein
LAGLDCQGDFLQGIWATSAAIATLIWNLCHISSLGLFVHSRSGYIGHESWKKSLLTLRRPE